MYWCATTGRAEPPVTKVSSYFLDVGTSTHHVSDVGSTTGHRDESKWGEMAGDVRNQRKQLVDSTSWVRKSCSSRKSVNHKCSWETLALLVLSKNLSLSSESLLASGRVPVTRSATASVEVWV